MSTIYILWLRQIKRYLRSKSRIFGSLAQPLLFLVAMGYGFGPIFQKAGEGNYIEFLTPGIIGMSIIFSSIFFGIEIIWDRQFGFLKETLVAPVSRINIMIGRTLGGATIATFQGLIVFFVAMIAGFRPVNLYLVPFAFLVMIAIAILFTSIGTAIASRLQDFQGFQLITNFLVMPLFFLSGALFPLQGLSPVIMNIARFDPLSYGIDALRGLLTGVFNFGMATDIAVISLVTVFFLLLGSYLFSKIEI
jgi:ABC-2 type transport system permease protein